MSESHNISGLGQGYLNTSPENVPTIFFTAGKEMIRIASDGFYVRGVKVNVDEQEARKVFDAFNAWIGYTIQNKEPDHWQDDDTLTSGYQELDKGGKREKG